jgi:hypothetical protein
MSTIRKHFQHNIFILDEELLEHLGGDGLLENFTKRLEVMAMARIKMRQGARVVYDSNRHGWPMG